MARPINIYMECPKCRSREIMIKRKTGMERIKVFWTGLREYKCRACDEVFRAEDRRRTPRETPASHGQLA
jgi:DNA-directed RNA polymerase subunit RPC12/RpoP